MQQMKLYEIDDKLLNKIISAAYGDAGPGDRFYVYLKTRKDPEMKKIYNEYKAVARLVGKIKELECPSDIRKLNSMPKAEMEKEHSFAYDLYSVLFVKPVWTFSVVIIFISVVALSVVFRKNEIQRTYSQKEIALADKQATQALKMVGDILNRTKSTVVREILPEKVSKPLNKGINVVKDLINEENKNENIN